MCLILNEFFSGTADVCSVEQGKIICSIYAYILTELTSLHTERRSRSSVDCGFSSVCLTVSLYCTLKPPPWSACFCSCAPTCEQINMTNSTWLTYLFIVISAISSDVCFIYAAALQRSEETGISKHSINKLCRLRLVTMLSKADLRSVFVKFVVVVV